MKYTSEQVDQIMASVKPPAYPDLVEVTPELLAGWITSTAKQDGNHRAYVVLGMQAVLSLSTQDWFVRGFDTTEADKEVGWWGSIFGSPVFVAPDLKTVLHDLDSRCIYVVSSDGKFCVSQHLR